LQNIAQVLPILVPRIPSKESHLNVTLLFNLVIQITSVLELLLFVLKMILSLMEPYVPPPLNVMLEQTPPAKTEPAKELMSTVLVFAVMELLLPMKIVIGEWRTRPVVATEIALGLHPKEPVGLLLTPRDVILPLHVLVMESVVFQSTVVLTAVTLETVPTMVFVGPIG